MKIMRSTKSGSACADCGAVINIGDPIAYFGPRSIYGLTCHTNDKTKKHLAALLKEEAATPQPEGHKRVTEVLDKAMELSVKTRELLEQFYPAVELDQDSDFFMGLLRQLCDVWGIKKEGEQG